MVTGEAPATDGLSNPSKRKLGRRDATGFKKLPHLDDLLFSKLAMSVPERGGMSMELHADSIAKLLSTSAPISSRRCITFLKSIFALIGWANRACKVLR